MYPSTWYGLVDEIPSGRSGSPLNPDGSRTYTRQFLVEVKSEGKRMGVIGVCSHPGLPKPWTFYITETEYDTLALLSSYSARQRDEDDWTFWIVTATYSTTNSGDFNSGGGPDGVGAPGDLPNNPSNAYSNPEYQYPDIKWNFEEVQKPALVDLDGKVYQNSALQPFTPPVQFPRAYPVLSITRNELNFNVVTAAAYAYAVNDANFLGFPAGFVQCMPPQADQQWRGTVRYWRVTYRLRFHPRGIFLPGWVFNQEGGVVDPTYYELNWQPVLQDQGFMRLEDRKDANGNPHKDFGKPVPIVRGPGQPVTQQVLLNWFGQPATGKDPATGQIVPWYKFFRQFASKSFTTLINRGFT